MLINLLLCSRILTSTVLFLARTFPGDLGRRYVLQVSLSFSVHCLVTSGCPLVAFRYCWVFDGHHFVPWSCFLTMSCVKINTHFSGKIEANDEVHTQIWQGTLLSRRAGVLCLFSILIVHCSKMILFCLLTAFGWTTGWYHGHWGIMSADGHPMKWGYGTKDYHFRWTLHILSFFSFFVVIVLVLCRDFNCILCVLILVQCNNSIWLRKKDRRYRTVVKRSLTIEEPVFFLNVSFGFPNRSRGSNIAIGDPYLWR